MKTKDDLASLHLAGARVVLVGDDPAWAGVLAGRYDGFRRTGGDGFRVTLHASGAPPAEARFVTPALDRPPRAVWDGARVSVDADPWRLRFDMAAREGHVHGPVHRTTIDMLLHLLLPLLVAGDGLVVHGALLATADAAWICSGPSGSGKSTLARLLPEQARCDELCVVRRAGGTWRAESLPFWQARPASALLAGIHLLRHGPSHARGRLSPAEATRRLTAEVRWPCEPAASARALRTLDELLAAVPVWDLAFRPTPDVWDVLSAPVVVAR